MQLKNEFTIHFKNGSTLDVSRVLAEKLRDHIAYSKGNFVTFNNHQGKLIVILNSQEIVHVAEIFASEFDKNESQEYGG